MTNVAQTARELDPPSAPTSRANNADIVRLTGARLPIATEPQAKEAAPAYTMTARILHWITAFGIFLMIPLGVVIGNDWSGSLQSIFYCVHETIGLLLMPTVLVRIAYRWAHPPLPLPHEIPELQQLAAQVVHGGLYALLAAQPLLGWMAADTEGSPIMLAGLVELPHLLPQNRALSEQIFALHAVTGLALAGLVGAHAAAALYHHLARKDRVLSRMITG